MAAFVPFVPFLHQLFSNMGNKGPSRAAQQAQQRAHEIKMTQLENAHKRALAAKDEAAKVRAQQVQQQMQLAKQEHERQMKEFDLKQKQWENKNRAKEQELKQQHEKEMNKLKSYMDNQIAANNNLTQKEIEDIKKTYEKQKQEIIERQKKHAVKLHEEQRKLQERAEKERKEHMRQIESMQEDQLKEQIIANTKTLKVMKTQKDNIRENLSAVEKRASEIQAIVSEETARLKKFEIVSLDENCKSIVILGPTGNGKTTSLKNLFNIKLIEDEKDAKENEVNAATKRIMPYKAPMHNIYMIDTPGQFDGDGEDEFNANGLVEFLKGCGGINAFLIVLNGSMPRFDSKLQDLFRGLVDILGNDMFKHTFLLATRIEGEEEFKWKKWSNDMKQKIKSCFRGANIDWPFIPISNVKTLGSQYTPEYAKNEIIKLLNGKFKYKFKPRELKAPLQEYKQTLQKLLTEKGEIEKEYLKLESEIFAIEEKIDECEKRISNKKNKKKRRINEIHDNNNNNSNNYQPVKKRKIA